MQGKKCRLKEMTEGFRFGESRTGGGGGEGEEGCQRRRV